MITIAATAELAAIADALLVYPTEVEINAADPISSLLVHVDNQNARKVLTWQVSDDQPWITLNNTLGATPDTLTVNIGSLPDPTLAMTATLTFTSPDIAGELLVPLRFIVGEAVVDDEVRLLLPAISTTEEGE